METLFTLPLAAVAVIQILLSLLLLSHRALSLPLSQALSKASKGTAARSVLGTVCMLLLGLFIASFLEVLRGSQRVRRDERVDLATLDYFRSQTSCVLCMLNLMLVLLNPALAETHKQKEQAVVSLDAMKRQVGHACMHACSALGLIKLTPRHPPSHHTCRSRACRLSTSA